MNFNKILLTLLVINCDASDNIDDTNVIFEELNFHFNLSQNKINISVSAKKKIRASTGYYTIKNNYEINYQPLPSPSRSYLEKKLKNNFPIFSRSKRFLDKPNCLRNESLKKIPVNLDKTSPESLKQKKIAPGDAPFVLKKQNQHNQLFTNKNATTSVGLATLSFLKQEFNTTDNETMERMKSSGEVKFLDVPPGGGMKVPDLQLGTGYVVFNYISSLVAELQTGDFPTGLFREWLWNRLSFVQLIIQTIRVEGGIIGLLLCFLLLALALPSAVLAHVSCHCIRCRCRFPSSNSDTHDIPVPPPCENGGQRCQKLVMVVVVEVMVLCMPLGIAGMFISNEHLAESVQRSPAVAQAVLEDVTTFIRNTHLQVRFVATTAVDQAVDAAVADLEDAETLLGRPIQRALTVDTGIDVALDALNDICTASIDIATAVVTLRAEAQAARDAIKVAQERLKELRRQVDQARRQCVDQDRTLCETIDTGGLEVVLIVDKLLSERKLSRLRHLGEDNMTSAAEGARQTFQDIPQRVVRDTALTRREIKTILRKQREVLYTSSEALEEVSRDFTSSVSIANGHVTQVVHTLTNVEQWRWITGLASSISILLIWFLITPAVLLSHFNCSDRVLPLYITSLILICTLSLVLWTVAAITLLLGGNGEILVCKPLYDDPNFTTITDLLDSPGMVFKHGGLFSNILKGNDSLDVPMKVLLSECRLNQPTFPTFQLNRIFNIDSLTNHLTWPKLYSHFHNLSVNINDTQVLKPTLQKYLQDLSAASRVNLTLYRQQLSGSVTMTDLSSFADQLERVAGQMHDLATSARMETLAARARKLLGNNLQRLEKHRDEIVYKLTALEVHLLPLQRQANQSLSHLKTIQYYLNNQGENISKKKTSEYVTRVVKYLERFREHVLTQLTYEVAPCRPLWDAYDAARVQVCRHVVEPMNAFWVSTVWCLLLFILMTPFLMLLIDYYKYVGENGYLSRRELNELLLSDQGPWTTPQTPESISTPEQQIWATPRRTSQQYLIPPPRFTPEPPRISISPVPGPSFRRLIHHSQSHTVPRVRQDEFLGMSEPVTWRSYGLPSPRRWH